MIHRSAGLNAVIIGVPAFLFALMIGLYGANTTTAGSFQLRPPYSGTYRLNTFFDHYYPDYTSDPDGQYLRQNPELQFHPPHLVIEPHSLPPDIGP